MCEHEHVQNLRSKLEEVGDIESIQMVNSEYKWMLKKIVSWKQQRFYGVVGENDSEKWCWNNLESHEKWLENWRQMS